MSFFDAFSSTVRSQRLTWSCCIVIALLLIYRFNAPLIPVLIGCILALFITGMKSRSFRSGAKH
jgi:hypothetical protein